MLCDVWIPSNSVKTTVHIVSMYTSSWSHLNKSIKCVGVFSTAHYYNYYCCVQIGQYVSRCPHTVCTQIFDKGLLVHGKTSQMIREFLMATLTV